MRFFDYDVCCVLQKNILKVFNLQVLSNLQNLRVFSERIQSQFLPSKALNIND